MPKMSKESAVNVDDHGIVEDRQSRGLRWPHHPVPHVPPGRGRPPTHEGPSPTTCATPHSGATCSRAGSPSALLTTRRSLEAGDAFHSPPLHIPIVDADSEHGPVQPERSNSTKASKTMICNMEAMRAGCGSRPPPARAPRIPQVALTQPAPQVHGEPFARVAALPAVADQGQPGALASRRWLLR